MVSLDEGGLGAETHRLRVVCIFAFGLKAAWPYLGCPARSDVQWHVAPFDAVQGHISCKLTRLREVVKATCFLERSGEQISAEMAVLYQRCKHPHQTA